MDSFNYDGQYSPEEELSSLPRDYTREIAHINKDIIFDQFISYNVSRFDEFLNNVNNKRSDKVRITLFGIDGPATTSILQYNGDVIRLTIDETRFGYTDEYYNYYGNQIISQAHERYGDTYETYYLVTMNSGLQRVFVNPLN